MMRRNLILFFCTLLGGAHAWAEPALKLLPAPTGQPAQLQVSGEAQRSQRIEFSPDLQSWFLFEAKTGERVWTSAFDAKASASGDDVRYFRVVETDRPSVPSHSSWKNTIALDDPFRSKPLPGADEFGLPGTEVRWIKFSILVDDLSTVYFQNSTRYPFHYDFATERLPGFASTTPAEFNAASLHLDNQRLILGAVLLVGDRSEFGVQIVGQDAFPAEMIRFVYRAVEQGIVGSDEATGFYVPTLEQAAVAQRQAGWFAGQGITVGSMDRWLGGTTCYTEGWALGRLVFVPGTEIDEAYLSGELLPSDILLTDGVPAEVPFVAGILSTASASPNSHVALLSQSYRIPFVYLARETLRTKATDLIGREVILRAGSEAFSEADDCSVLLEDASHLSADYKKELLAVRDPTELEFAPIETRGALVVSDLSTVTLADIRFVGGKAANFGFLRREIPDASPEAIALTFDLWNQYLEQTVEGGGTLRDFIEAKLAPHQWPVDIGALAADLSEIREVIKDDTDFSASAKQELLAALAGAFDADQRIRFRSSTNVEDSESFIGAGLYDSFSGCLADDLDDDERGASHCDPEEPKERGVFRAIRKVFASFYNLNAVVERLRHRVDESKVGMAVLVHYSFPDETEAANGVCTAEFRSFSWGDNLSTKIVSQIGAQSVTNPSGGSLPEVVRGYVSKTNFSDSNTVTLEQRSTLLLLGQEHVMNWEKDYQAFQEHFFVLAKAYAKATRQDQFTLDFEYKKLTDGSLVVKQIRKLPNTNTTIGDKVALVDVPRTLLIYQGELGADVFAFHRLKSTWQMATDSRFLDDAGVATSVFGEMEMQHAANGEVYTMTGLPSEWPGADHRLEKGDNDERIVIDSWTGETEGGMTTFELILVPPKVDRLRVSPLFSMGDLDVDQYYYQPTSPGTWRPYFAFGARYEKALPANNQFDGSLGTTREEQVPLFAGRLDDPLPEGAREREETFQDGGVTITTSYNLAPWPPIGAGYTSPLVKWGQTTITGATTEPIVLTSYFSQTYKPAHHNFDGEFIFEPQLDDGVTAAQLAELEGKDIRFFYVPFARGPKKEIRAMGLDGKIRDL